MDESKALALRDEGGALTPAALDSLPQHARERVAALIVRGDEYRWYSNLADKMQKGNMLPKGMNAQGAAICMLEGQQFGFTELQSLKHLTAINNTVGLMNVGAMAILRQNNALKKGTTVEKSWFWEPLLDGEEVLEEGLLRRLLTNQTSKAQGVERLHDDVFNSIGCSVTMHKKGHAKPFEDSFTIGDAKRLGKWGGIGPWSDNPMRMLFNRAWGRILTDHFSEYTSGLQLEGEIRDQEVIDIDPADSIAGLPVTSEDDGDPLGDIVAEASEMPSEETEETYAEAPENVEVAQEEAEEEEPDPIEAFVSAEEILGDQSREGMGDHHPAEMLPPCADGIIDEEALNITPGGLPPFSLGEDEELDPDPLPEAPTVPIACPHCMEPGDYPIGMMSSCWNAECMADLKLDDEGNLVESA